MSDSWFQSLQIFNFSKKKKKSLLMSDSWFLSLQIFNFSKKRKKAC